VITDSYNDAAYPTALTSTANGLSETTTYTYDAEGRLLTTLNSNKTAETVAYNSNGQVCSRAPTTLTYPCGEGPAAAGVSQYTYNVAGNVISMSDNVGDVADTGLWNQTTNYTYANGQLGSTTDANNQTVSYMYNYAGQVTCEAYPVSTGASCGTVATPQLGSSTNTVVNRSYDAAGRLLSSQDWLGNTVTYAYGDANDPSAVTNITYPSSTNLETTYGYDAAGNLTCMSVAAASVSPSCAQTNPLLSDAWTYNADEQVLTSTVNGTTSSPVTYNANKQITAATNLGTSTSNDSYNVAANGEISSDVSPSNSSVGFTYNQGDQLCNSSFGTSATPSSVGCGNAPTNGTQYSYDANGNRTSATPYSAGVAGASTKYSWNALGELCGIGPTALSCSATPASGTSYTYNGEGLRRQILTSTSSTSSTWDTVSGGSLPLNINDATTTSGSLTNTSYLYGNLLFGGAAPVEQITTTNAGATPVFLISSPTGVQGVVSSSGTLLESAVYSPYGTQSLAPGTSSVTPFGFQGSYTDATGLIYLINRYYDPSTDSFISVDPDLQSTDQAYVFTNDNPLNGTDPLGLFCIGLCTFTDAAHAVVKVVNKVSTFAKQHVGDIVTGVAILACVGTFGTVCAVATAVAVAARVYQRHEEGTPYLSTSNILDAGITLVSGGLLGGPANIGEGVFSNSSSAWTYAYRLHTAAPDILGWIVGTATHKDVP